MTLHSFRWTSQADPYGDAWMENTRQRIDWLEAHGSMLTPQAFARERAYLIWALGNLEDAGHNGGEFEGYYARLKATYEEIFNYGYYWQQYKNA